MYIYKKTLNIKTHELSFKNVSNRVQIITLRRNKPTVTPGNSQNDYEVEITADN